MYLNWNIIIMTVCHIKVGVSVNFCCYDCSKEGRCSGHKIYLHADKFKSFDVETNLNALRRGSIFVLMPENLLPTSFVPGHSSSDRNLCQSKWDDRVGVVIHLFFYLFVLLSSNVGEHWNERETFKEES